jgi:hypothetical protein
MYKEDRKRQREKSLEGKRDGGGRRRTKRNDKDTKKGDYKMEDSEKSETKE